MLIRNARDCAGKPIEVWLRDGKIAAVGLGLLVPEGEELLDAKGRMDVVDRCYYEMRRYRNLVSYYTNKNIAVSYLRARKKNDLDRVMRLYGNETSKYW